MLHCATSSQELRPLSLRGIQAGKKSPLEAANMLWLIQRDFLEGQSVQQMVNAALEPVPNPDKDADIEQVA